MAKKKAWDEPIDYKRRDLDWGIGDETTDNLPLAGSVVQKYIKDNFDHKGGYFYTNISDAICYVFATPEDCSTYFDDPDETHEHTKHLIIGSFEVPSKYAATITVAPGKETISAFAGSTGNYIEFTWDIKHVDTGTTNEGINCTYTITNGSWEPFSETVPYTASNKNVQYLTDKHLHEGTNIVTVDIVGLVHKVSMTYTFTVNIVNLQLSDEINISNVYNATDSNRNRLRFNYKVSGNGQASMEWYFDGQKVASTNEELNFTINEAGVTKTKNFDLTSKSQGRHVLQYRAYVMIGGEKFYSNILYRDVIIYNNYGTNPIFAIKTEIPREYGYTPGDLVIKNMTQYVPFQLTYALYSPSKQSNIPVDIYLNDTLVDSTFIDNGIESVATFTPKESGNGRIRIQSGSSYYNINTEIAMNSLGIYEINDNLEFNFIADRTNQSVYKDQWTYELPNHEIATGNFNGFGWSNASGWVDNRLLINNGASFSITNYTPLYPDPIREGGKTFEFEFSTLNVSNDNEVLCDLTNANGVGIKITATEASLTSAKGQKVNVKYKSGVGSNTDDVKSANLRVSFVIRPASEGLVLMYVNGILSGAVNYESDDSFASSKNITFAGKSSAEISIKQIRIYSAPLENDQILNNYILYRDSFDEMTTLVDLNNIYVDGLPSIEKLARTIPVMVVTGDLEYVDKRSDKSELTLMTKVIYYDYIHNHSFVAFNTGFSPQGTSSMKYPRRNYRMYNEEKKLKGIAGWNMDDFHFYIMDCEDINGGEWTSSWTELPWSGKEGKHKVYYQFRDDGNYENGEPQGASRWTLKADFAESSSTHNTGVARLWNNVLYNANVTYTSTTASQYFWLTAKKADNTRDVLCRDTEWDEDGNPVYQYYTDYKYESVQYTELKNYLSDASVKIVSAVPTSNLSYDSSLAVVIQDHTYSVNKEYACRTNAQKIALENNFGYDVRTCVDGFPIVMFYHKTEDEPLQFMGKYNFNNDKSSESIFGFCDIDKKHSKNPDDESISDWSFDKSTNTAEAGYPGYGKTFEETMQCWELIDSGDDIALYKNLNDWDVWTESSDTHRYGWGKGFEARYPDDQDTEGTQADNAEAHERWTTYVKPFAEWMVGIHDDAWITRTSGRRQGRDDGAGYTSYSEYIEVSLAIISGSLDKIKSIEYYVERLGLDPALIDDFPNINTVIKDYDPELEDTEVVKYISKTVNDVTKYYLQNEIKTYDEILNWENPARFASEKWKHFDMYKMAAYYIYLIRFAAVDQTVKNAMWTSEDGQHWYYINYDNDTILGVRNDGRLKYGPDITRKSWDPEINDYCYAARESTLWNALEADDEFMNQIVPAVDDALFNAGFNYNTLLNIFEDEQSNKWCEKIYNDDAQYKYVQSYWDGNNYLESMQGSRKTHRRWWLSHRFDYYDALFLNSSYKQRSIYFLAPNTPIGDNKFSITSGNDAYFAYGTNGRIQESGIHLFDGSTYSFPLYMTLQIGSPVSIYNPWNIKEINLRNLKDNTGKYTLSQLNLSEAYDEKLGSKVKKLYLGDHTNPQESRFWNTGLRSGGLVSLGSLKSLEELDITDFSQLNALNGINSLQYLRKFYAKNTGLSTISFANGVPLEEVELPGTLTSLTFNGVATLTVGGLTLQNGGERISEITITNSKGLSNNFKFIHDWYDAKLTPDAECSLHIDNIVWNNVDGSELLDLAKIGSLNLVGTIKLDDVPSDEDIITYQEAFGDNVFTFGNPLYITAPENVRIKGPESVLEGSENIYQAIIFSEHPGTYTFTIVNGTKDGSTYHSPLRDGITLYSDTGLLVVEENGEDPCDITIRLQHVSTEGTSRRWDQTVHIGKRTYPSDTDVYIDGNTEIISRNTYTYKYPAYVDGSMYAIWNLDQSSELAKYVNYSVSPDGKSIDIIRNAESLGENPVVEGTLSVTLYRNYDAEEVAYAEKELSILNSDIALTQLTNPEVYEIMWNKFRNRKLFTEGCITKQEAASFTAEDFSGSTSLSSVFANSNIKSFNELVYFENLEEIPSYMFYNCADLTSVTLPPNITKIGIYSFNGSGIREIAVTEGVVKIENGAFSGASNLVTVILPTSLTQLDPAVFLNCYNLTNINLPPSLTEIGAYCFCRTNISHINIPGSVTSISSDSQFVECPLETITVSDDNTIYNSIGNCNAIIENSTHKLILGCKNTIIPSTVKSIGSQAFYGIKNLPTTFTIPEGVTEIGARAFYESTGLQNIILPYTLKTIGERVFYNLTSLTSVTFREGLESIGEYAFYQCNLQSIYLPSTVSSIGAAVFSNNNNLRTIIVSTDNAVYDSRNDCNAIIETVTNTLISGCCYTVIPNTVEVIGNGAFMYCNNDTVFSDIVLPSSVRKIDENAFNSCYSIRSINLENVTELGKLAFFLCRELVDVSLGEGLTEIPNECFEYCWKLSSVKFPSTLQTIGTSAFYNCQANEFVSIDLSNTVIRTIGNRAFEGCYHIETIKLPATIESLGVATFENCQDVSEIFINKNVPPTVDAVTHRTWGYYDAANTVTGSEAESLTLYIKSGSRSNWEGSSQWSEWTSYLLNPDYHKSTCVITISDIL